MADSCLKVALPAPLMRLFDYRRPAGWPALRPGQRLRVPFGGRELIGIVIETDAAPAVPASKLREPSRLIDTEPLLPADLLALLNWASAYYQHPPGEVCATALPAALRRGDPLPEAPSRWWPAAGGDAKRPAGIERRAPAQAAALAALDAADGGLADPEDERLRRALRALEKKGLAVRRPGPWWPNGQRSPAPGPVLSDDQQRAADAIAAADGFSPFLLEGVTGSGKTEVYLAAAARCLAAGRQCLVLVPEIGLTPQLLARFESRLGLPVATLHSGLADGERLRAWLAAARGDARVIIGTRSAVFTPLARPGLIIVDEEHDASYKQQDGFRYSARDLAVRRAQQLGLPVVLGSATPALESLENARSGRYRSLTLPERAGSAQPPRVRLIDLRRHPPQDGLSAPLLDRITRHLRDEGQVLVYLNRRGFAPVLVCTGCGGVVECRRCDARLVLHRGRAQLACHHCGARRPAPAACADCGAELLPVGLGTERIEQALQAHFPDAGLVRIDRDTTRRRGAIEAHLAAVRRGEVRILLGTQMLAKGHDFPNVTLVAIVDADQGLFGTDFRAGERLAQAFVQVAGRAGRAERSGEVCIQTLHPEHALLQRLLDGGYRAFAEQALAERREAGWPPFAFLALLRAEAVRRERAFAFLDEAAACARDLGLEGVELLGPAPAPMPRRQGRERGQLLLRAARRGPLQAFLAAWRPALEALPAARFARWSLDVDPVELF
ncbi:MAG: primosomal protein N' [Gammaproteobacteria bacterium]|nr:MAG: primosomal protein N' [Gammaproteobacteria bacterium]